METSRNSDSRGRKAGFLCGQVPELLGPRAGGRAMCPINWHSNCIQSSSLLAICFGDT